MCRLLLAAAALVLANGVNSSLSEPRIIGGAKTNIETYPYMLSVRVFDTHFCGGAILTRRSFVTAARCLSTLPSLPFYYKVRVGSSSIHKGGKLIVVQKCAQHPKYVTFQHNYDVSIGTLQTPLDFGADHLTIQPIALIDLGDVPKIGDLFKVSGWGPSTAPVLGQENKNKDAEDLHAVEISYVHRDECRVFDRKDVNSPYTWQGTDDALICAGGAGRTVYKTDFGAPLVNRKRQLVGIATRPHDIPNIKWPGLYANIAHPPIHKFIVENTNYS